MSAGGTRAGIEPSADVALVVFAAFADAVLEEFPVKRQRAILARAMTVLERRAASPRLGVDQGTDEAALRWWRAAVVGWLANR